MDYSVAEEAQVLAAAFEALKGRRTMRSETALLKSVRARLKKDDPRRTVGRRRLRLVCLRSGQILVTAFTRYSDERRAVTRCPVCHGAISPIKNRTVYDGSVTLGYRCKVCGFWTGIRRRVPTLYVYSRRNGAPGDDGEPRGLRLVEPRQEG